MCAENIDSLIAAIFSAGLLLAEEGLCLLTLLDLTLKTNADCCVASILAVALWTFYLQEKMASQLVSKDASR